MFKFEMIKMLVWFSYLLVLISAHQIKFGFSNNEDNLSNKKFPKDFLFGVATSAYQIEGAWNVDGKGESIWDYAVHSTSKFRADNSTADVACDFYHKYKEDIKLMKDLDIKSLRLSISWSRILPLGTAEYINKKGIEFYRSLIKELLANGIQPFVTIYHWDLPQKLQERGGLLNIEFVNWYSDFARILFKEFGDLVKVWFTFNEPQILCTLSYGDGILAPGIKRSGFDDYICGHNVLLAHARVYHIYDKEFRPTQKGKITVVLSSPWIQPGTMSDDDVKATDTAMQFQLGWFANPIYHGNYPPVMIARISKRSCELEGRNKSRLPVFTQDDVEYIRGTSDFFALNHYFTNLAFALPEAPGSEGPSFYLDMNVNLTQSSFWERTCSNNLFVVTPFGMRMILNYIKFNYHNPPIMVTENGRCDFGDIQDDKRIDFITSYLSNVNEAIHEDGVNVLGYFAWSFMDSWEWASGYIAKSGLVQVDFSSKNLTRTPKKSAYAYQKIIKTRCLVDKCEKSRSF